MRSEVVRRGSEGDVDCFVVATAAGHRSYFFGGDDVVVSGREERFGRRELKLAGPMTRQN
jgi:hypothetical protein